jgi:hypothetical protein
MKNKCQIVYYNEWGNRIVLFTGTLERCQEIYEKNIGKCESVEATIEDYYKGEG